MAHKGKNSMNAAKIIGIQFSVLSPEEILSLIHISEPTRRRGISYAVFCLKKKK